jgi:hypothetical protein
MNEVIESAVSRWTDPERRPLFKGSLVDETGCMCAQGDILHHELGWSIEKLRATEQAAADQEVAKALGISIGHAILLRNINDQADGAPQTVLTEPAKVLGDQAHIVLAFWWHMDQMTAEQWDAARAAARAAARDAARAAAWDAAWDAARDAARAAARAAARDAARAAAWDAARAAAWAAAWDAAWDAAAYACAEIQGARLLREQGKEFYFLPMFGFADPEAVLAAYPQFAIDAA